MFKSKVLIRQLQSSLVIAILPLVTILLLTNHLITNVEARENLLYEMAGNSICSVAQYTLETICNASHVIAQNTTICDYASGHDPHYWTEHEIASVMGENIVGIPYVGECFVYLEHFDRILSTQTSHSSAFYFEHCSELSQQVLLEAYESSYQYALLLSDGHLCAFAKMLDRYNQPVGYCVIVLDLPELIVYINQIAPNSINALALFYEHTLLTASTGGEWLAAFADGQGMIDPVQVSMEQEHCYLNQCSIYGRVFSVLLTRSRDTKLNNAMIWVWIACFLLTMTLCVVLSYMNYKPVKRISTLVNGSRPRGEETGENEYQIIEKSLLTYERQIEWLSEKIRIQNEKFRHYYLEKLLLNQLPPRESIGDVLSFFGMAFHHRENFVLIAEAENDDSQLMAGSEMDLLEEDDILMNLFEMMQENIGPNEHLYRLQIDHKWIFVCAVRDAAAYRSCISDCLEKLTEDFTGRVELHLGENVDCGEKLWQSYRDALQQIESAASNRAPEAADCGSSRQKDYSSQCIELIHQHYADEALNAEALAEACGVTLAYLSKIFKKEVGMGLLEYLQRYRIDSAKKMMAQSPEIRINVLCENVGYSNVATFIRVFKKYEGISPGSYRDQLLKNDQV